MFTTRRLLFILCSILLSIFVSNLIKVSPERRGPMIAGALVIVVVVLYLVSSGKLSQERIIEKVTDVRQKREDEQINEAFREHSGSQNPSLSASENEPSKPKVKPVIHDGFQADSTNNPNNPL